MNIIKKHLPKSPQKRPMAYGKKTHITIHSTGNDNSTAHGEIKYLHRPDNKTYVSYHYVVGEDVIYEAIPPGEVAYHGGNRTANWNSIGIEMVHTGDRNKVIENTIKLVKKLQKAYPNISDDNVVRHHDWPQKTKSGRIWYKDCPSILNYNNWQGWVEFKTLLRSDDNMNEEQIRKIVREEMNPSSVKSGLHNWANPHYVNLNARGIEVNEKRFADVITRGAVFALLDRVTSPDNLLKLIEHAEQNQ